MLEHTDDQIGPPGRLPEVHRPLRRHRLSRRVSDNGAKPRGGQSGVLDEMKWFNGIRENVDEAVQRLEDIGGPDSHCNIPWGWAQAMALPRSSGTSRTPTAAACAIPFILHWPAGLTAKGETRNQFCHVIDVARPSSTCWAFLSPGPSPACRRCPMHGVSPRCARAGRPERENWRATRSTSKCSATADSGRTAGRRSPCPPPASPSTTTAGSSTTLADDFSEYEDLAASEPERLKSMIALWEAEADTRNGVFPLDDRNAMTLFRASMRLGHHFRAHARASSITRRSRTWSPTPAPPGPGLRSDDRRDRAPIRRQRAARVVARGSLNSGFVLFVKDGRLVFDYNHFHEHTRITADTALTPGGHARSRFSLTRRPDGGGDIELQVDGHSVEAPASRRSCCSSISSTGMDIGRSLSPITETTTPRPTPIRAASPRWSSRVPDTRPRGEVKAEARAESGASSRGFAPSPHGARRAAIVDHHRAALQLVAAELLAAAHAGSLRLGRRLSGNGPAADRTDAGAGSPPPAPARQRLTASTAIPVYHESPR